MDSFGRTEIFYFIVNGDEEQFLTQLEIADNINVQDNSGMTLLHFAAEYNRVTIAERLISKGIELEIKDNYGNTALWKAVFNARGNYDLVKALIKNKADPTSLNNAGKSPLILAKTMADEEMINILQNG